MVLDGNVALERAAMWCGVVSYESGYYLWASHIVTFLYFLWFKDRTMALSLIFVPRSSYSIVALLKTLPVHERLEIYRQ